MLMDEYISPVWWVLYGISIALFVFGLIVALLCDCWSLP
jgi:hypothetical protein